MALTKIPTHMLFSGAASEDLSIDSDTLFIDSSANRVGIANNSPSVALDVTGALTASGVVTANAGVVVDNITIDGTEIDLSSGDLTIDAAGRIDLSADDNGEIRFYDGSLMYGQFKEDSSNLVLQSLVSDKDLILRGNDDGTEITALTLDMSDLGSAKFNGPNLNITADDARLLVEEADGTNIGWYGDITGGGVGGCFLYNHGGTATVQLRADATASFINNGANFGIGTASPQGRLHLVGPSSGQVELYLSDADEGTGASDSLLITKSGTSSYIYDRDASSSLRLGAADNHSILFIDGSNARVGIGTTSPSANLEVASALATLRLTDTDGGYHQVRGNSAHLILQADEGDDVGSSTIQFHVDSAEKMRLTDDGYLGIGATSPEGALDVNIGTAGVWTGVFHNTASGGAGVLIKSTGDTGSENVLDVRNGTGTIFKVAQAGATVTIGNGQIADPKVVIDSATGGDPQLIFDTGAANRTGIIQFKDEGTVSGFIKYEHNGDKLNFGSGSSTTVSMTVNDGNVGISEASTSPVANLDVDGTIVHGNIRNEKNATRTYTNGSALNGGVIEFTTTISGSDEYNCVITWAKGTWSAFSYEFTFSAASWARKIAGGGYHNNSGGTISGHTNEDLYGGSNESDLAISGTDQTIVFTIQCPNGTHPMVHAKFMIGGSANPDPDDFTVEWVAR